MSAIHWSGTEALTFAQLKMMVSGCVLFCTMSNTVASSIGAVPTTESFGTFVKVCASQLTDRKRMMAVFDMILLKVQSILVDDGEFAIGGNSIQSSFHKVHSFCHGR